MPDAIYAGHLCIRPDRMLCSEFGESVYAAMGGMVSLPTNTSEQFH
jgi:hypothetical protein